MTARNNNNVANETPSIVLKTIYDDIMKANANSTLTTKKMRAVLRTKMNDIHVHNASWLFTPTQYDAARAMFDPEYAAKIERQAKRAAKPARTRKAKVETKVDVAKDEQADVNV